MTLHRFAVAAAVSLFASAGFAQDVSIESCQATFTYDQPPTRAIALYQQATEIMLALGLEDRMIATAYLEDEIPEQWRAAYDSIEVHYERLPAREVVLATDANFLLAGFDSAYRDTNLGPEAEWHEIGVGTYLVDSECRNKYPGNVPVQAETIFVDLERIGALFGVEERAQEVADDIASRLDVALEEAPGAGLTAFLFDSGDDTPYTGGCCGSPNLLLESVGLTSISANIEGRWADIAWEAVVIADPDVIILNDAGWSTAQEKRDYMENDPVLAELTAVREGRFIVVLFSETLLGMRFVDGVERLSRELKALEIEG